MKSRYAVLLFPALVVPMLVQGAANTSADAAPRCSVPSKGVIKAKDLPQHSNAVSCRAVGRVIDLGKTQITVPAAGQSVTMNRLLPLGSDITTILTSVTGVLTYSYTDVNGETVGAPADDEPAVDPPAGYEPPVAGEEAEESDYGDASEGTAAAAGTTAEPRVANNCVNTTYGLLSRKLYARKSYYIGDGTVPAGGTFAQWQTAIATAAKSWVNENSPCTSSDGSAVPALTYAGKTTLESNINYTSCGTPDGYSVIDAGNLDRQSDGDLPLAVACVGGVSHSGMWAITTFDIKFNTTDYNFIYYNPANPGACSNKFDLVSVLTHELGHAVGLADLPDTQTEAVYQTMFESIPPCKYYPRTLNMGDVTGLRYIY